MTVWAPSHSCLSWFGSPWVPGSIHLPNYERHILLCVSINLLHGIFNHMNWMINIFLESGCFSLSIMCLFPSPMRKYFAFTGWQEHVRITHHYNHVHLENWKTDCCHQGWVEAGSCQNVWRSAPTYVGQNLAVWHIFHETTQRNIPPAGSSFPPHNKPSPGQVRH